MKVRAPGRVNLIGEHTDYNQGFVLPIAIQLETTITTGNSSQFKAHSAQRNETATFVLDQPANHHWIDYIVGVARQLDVHPVSLHIESTIPEGAGLSSSAALEVATALALLGDRELDRLEIAKLCQRAESEFVGMPCGIMDQYVSLFGQAHAALKIDCRTLESEPVPLPDNVAILAVNSMVKHELGQSAYRTRVAECQEACRQIGVTSLRDATLEQAKPWKRARHIVTENQRVLDFVKAAAASNLKHGTTLPRIPRQHARRLRNLLRRNRLPRRHRRATTRLLRCQNDRRRLRRLHRKPRRSRIGRRLYQTDTRTLSAYEIDPQVIPCIPAAGACKIRETNSHETH